MMTGGLVPQRGIPDAAFRVAIARLGRPGQLANQDLRFFEVCERPEFGGGIKARRRQEIGSAAGFEVVLEEQLEVFGDDLRRHREQDRGSFRFG